MLSTADRFGGLKTGIDINVPGPNEYVARQKTIADDAQPRVKNTKASWSATRRHAGTEFDLAEKRGRSVEPLGQEVAFEMEKAAADLDVREIGGPTVVRKEHAKLPFQSRTRRPVTEPDKPSEGGPGKHLGPTRPGDISAPLRTFQSRAKGFGTTRRYDITDQTRILSGFSADTPGPASYDSTPAAVWNKKSESKLLDDDDGTARPKASGPDSARTKSSAKEKDPFAYIYDVPDHIPPTSVLRAAPGRRAPDYPTAGPGFNDVATKARTFGNYSHMNTGGGRMKHKAKRKPSVASSVGSVPLPPSLATAPKRKGPSVALDDPDGPLMKALAERSAGNDDQSPDATRTETETIAAVSAVKPPRPSRPPLASGLDQLSPSNARRHDSPGPGSHNPPDSTFFRPSANQKLSAPATVSFRAPETTASRISASALKGVSREFSKPFRPGPGGGRRLRADAASSQGSLPSEPSRYNEPLESETKLAAMLFKSKRYPVLSGFSSRGSKGPGSVAATSVSHDQSIDPTGGLELQRAAELDAESAVLAAPSHGSPASEFSSELLRLQYAGDEEGVAMALAIGLGGRTTRPLLALAERTTPKLASTTPSKHHQKQSDASTPASAPVPVPAPSQAPVQAPTPASLGSSRSSSVLASAGARVLSAGSTSRSPRATTAATTESGVGSMPDSRPSTAGSGGAVDEPMGESMGDSQGESMGESMGGGGESSVEE